MIKIWISSLHAPDFSHGSDKPRPPKEVKNTNCNYSGIQESEFRMACEQASSNLLTSTKINGKQQVRIGGPSAKPPNLQMSSRDISF